MYIVPPSRPHRSLFGQPIIGVGSRPSFSTYPPSSSSSPTSGSSSSNSNSSRSRRTKSSNTQYTNGLSSSNTSFSRYPPCPPAYENRRLRRRDAFGVGETAMLPPRASPTMTPSSRRPEMPMERIPAVVRQGRPSRYDNYYSLDDEDDHDDYRGSRYRRELEPEYRYSRRNGENHLRSFSEHARRSGRQELLDLMSYASDDDDDIISWRRYCRTC